MKKDKEKDKDNKDKEKDPEKKKHKNIGKIVRNKQIKLVDAVHGKSYETADTNSPVIDSKVKELELTSSFMKAIHKGMSKQQKHLKLYSEAGEELTQALNTYSTSGYCSDEIAASIDFLLKFENVFKNQLYDLHKHHAKVQDAIDTWIAKTSPEAKSEKKKFDNVRKILDESNRNLARLENSEKTPGEKAKLKQKEAQTEKDLNENNYNQQGEKTYNFLMDTIESTKFFYLNQLLEHFNGYEVFLRQGDEFIKSNHVQFDDMKAKAIKEQQQFRSAPPNRPKGIWSPGVFGDSKRLFAMNYQQVIERDKPPGNILVFLDQCFNLLERPAALKTTGIFRVSPPKPALDAIREKIDKGQPLPVDEIGDEVNMLTGLIKLFLRELPSPLLTFDLYRDWMSTVDIPNTNERVQITKELVSRLPPANAVLLERLIYLCTKILEHQNENKMNVDNLAIVLCPSILYDSDPNPLTMVADIQKSNGIMVNMIQNFRSIFESITNTRSKTAAALAPPSSPPPGLPGPISHSLPTIPPPLDVPPPLVPTKTPPGIKTNSREPDSDIGTESDPEDSEEYTNKGIILTFRGTPLTPGQVYGLNEKVDQTVAMSYYLKLYELWDGTFVFCKAVMSLSPQSNTYIEDLQQLNNAFSIVGKAIKTMLSFIKSYGSIYPPEIEKRIIYAANRVRPHIKTLINFIKAYNTKQSLDCSGLKSVTRSFVVASQLIFLTCYRMSQADELTQVAYRCKNLITELETTLKDDQQQIKSSILLNILQNDVLKFTSYLRSCIPDLLDSIDLQNEISDIVETIEQSIGDVFDEARIMLDQNQLHLTDPIKQNNTKLDKSISQILALRPKISEVISRNIDTARMIDATIKQIEMTCELHRREIDNEEIRKILNLFEKISQIIKELGEIYPQLIPSRLPPAGTTPSSSSEKPELAIKQKEWFMKCTELIQIFSTKKEIIVKLATEIEDESLVDVFKSYLGSIDHFIVQFLQFSTVASFGINVKDYETCVWIVPIKDYTFLMYPFIFNLLEAAGGNNNK